MINVNININVQGIFSSNIEADIVSVVAGLVNHEGLTSIDGSTLKEKLMSLAKNSESKDVDINIPVDSSAQTFDFSGLGEKIKDAILRNQADKPSSTFADKAKDLLQTVSQENPQANV